MDAARGTVHRSTIAGLEEAEGAKRVAIEVRALLERESHCRLGSDEERDGRFAFVQLCEVSARSILEYVRMKRLASVSNILANLERVPLAEGVERENVETIERYDAHRIWDEFFSVP